MNGRLLVLALVAGCGGDSVQTVRTGGGEPETEHDTTAPVIEHDPITASQPYLTDVDIDAVVTDEGSGVLVVSVYYARIDSTVWKSGSLTLTDEETGLFEGVIPGAEVTSSGMKYYLEAYDKEGNSVWDPEDGEADPYQFRIDGDT